VNLQRVRSSTGEAPSHGEGCDPRPSSLVVVTGSARIVGSGFDVHLGRAVVDEDVSERESVTVPLEVASPVALGRKTSIRYRTNDLNLYGG